MVGQGNSFSFDAGRVSLDFMATLGNRGSRAPVERLADRQSLTAWFVGAGLVGTQMAVSREELQEARALREALAAIVHARMSQQAVAVSDVRAVNQAAQTPVPPPRLRVQWGRLGRADPALSAAQALSVIARDGIDLLAGSQSGLLRECEGEDCTGVFVDASRGSRRRWCSTARCGNRARVAAHRSRHAERSDG